MAICVGMAVAMLGAAIIPALLPVLLALDVALVAWIVLAGATTRAQPVSVIAKWGKRHQIGRETALRYELENRGKKAVVVRVRQRWPQTWESNDHMAHTTVGPGELVELELRATPLARGRVQLPRPEVDVRFPGGLASHRWLVEDVESVSVYPDLTSVRDYETLKRSRALRQMGVHLQRMVGAGREFEQLRAYLPDDDYRDINWKATARRRSPVVNVWRAERSQDVLLCIDCGRMMGDPIGDGKDRRTALDHAVDAGVLLAHVAADQGDRVGLCLFKDQPGLFLKPESGPRAVNRIIEELVDASAEGVFPSYPALARTLALRHKRRSLIVMFTDMNDPQLAADLCAVAPTVSARHVLLVVSLRDPGLDASASAGAADSAEVCDVLAARTLADERDRRVSDLRRHGVHVLEAEAGAMGLSLINRYLEIKMRQLL